MDHKDRKGLLDLPEQMVLMVHRDPKEIKVTREIPVLPDPKGLPEPMVPMALSDLWDLPGPKDLPELTVQMVLSGHKDPLDR